jgi:hypothetical protein
MFKNQKENHSKKEYMEKFIYLYDIIIYLKNYIMLVTLDGLLSCTYFSNARREKETLKHNCYKEDVCT